MAAFAATRQVGNAVFLSGQIAPEPDRIPASSVVTQTKAAFREVVKLLDGHGLSVGDIQYVTGYLNDPADFDDYHRTWQQLFPVDPPARTTVSATILAENALVELSVVAAPDRSARR